MGYTGWDTDSKQVKEGIHLLARRINTKPYPSLIRRACPLCGHHILSSIRTHCDACQDLKKVSGLTDGQLQRKAVIARSMEA